MESPNVVPLYFAKLLLSSSLFIWQYFTYAKTVYAVTMPVDRMFRFYCQMSVVRKFLEKWIFLSGYFWGEWPSGLRRCSKNRKVLGSNPTRHLAGLRDPTSLQDSWWPLGRKCKTQWVVLGEWGCLVDNGPKLAMRQLNSS